MNTRSSQVAMVLLAGATLFVFNGCRKSKPPAPAANGSSSTVSSGAPSTSAPLNLPADEKVRAVIQDLIARYEAIDVLIARTEQKMNHAMDLKGNTHGKGEFTMKKSGDQRLTVFRINNRFEFAQKDPKNIAPIRTQEIVWQHFDGKDLYLLYLQHNLKRIVRTHYDPSRVWKIGGRDLFREILDENEVTLLPDEDLNGRPAHVFSVKPRDGDWSGKQWFDKKLGIRLKMIETDASGAESFSLVINEIDENPMVPDDTFVFTKREDFEFIDEVDPPPPGSEPAPATDNKPESSEPVAPAEGQPSEEKKDGTEPEKSEAPPEKSDGNSEPE